MTIKKISRVTGIPENTLYRAKSGRNYPHKNTLKKIHDAGFDVVQFIQPHLKELGLRVIKE